MLFCASGFRRGCQGGGCDEQVMDTMPHPLSLQAADNRNADLSFSRWVAVTAPSLRHRHPSASRAERPREAVAVGTLLELAV